MMMEMELMMLESVFELFDYDEKKKESVHQYCHYYYHYLLLY